MKRPNEFRYDIMRICKLAREDTGIPLHVIAKLSNFSCQYLRNIEAGRETISPRVVVAYQQVVELFTKNKIITENQKKLLTLC